MVRSRISSHHYPKRLHWKIWEIWIIWEGGNENLSEKLQNYFPTSLWIFSYPHTKIFRKSVDNICYGMNEMQEYLKT
jgi:hypothetical protein